jgi:hypothetical protein
MASRAARDPPSARCAHPTCHCQGVSVASGLWLPRALPRPPARLSARLHGSWLHAIECSSLVAGSRSNRDRSPCRRRGRPSRQRGDPASRWMGASAQPRSPLVGVRHLFHRRQCVLRGISLAGLSAASDGCRMGRRTLLAHARRGRQRLPKRVCRYLADRAYTLRRLGLGMDASEVWFAVAGLPHPPRCRRRDPSHGNDAGAELIATAVAERC